jgi:hypothetical protein
MRTGPYNCACQWHPPSELCHARKHFVNHLFGAARRLVHETLTHQRFRANHARLGEWSPLRIPSGDLRTSYDNLLGG